VGSYFEGFGQPGLDALACGVLLPAPLLPTIPITSPGPAEKVIPQSAQNASPSRRKRRRALSTEPIRLPMVPSVLPATTARKLRGRWYRTRYFNQTSLRSKPGSCITIGRSPEEARHPLGHSPEGYSASRVSSPLPCPGNAEGAVRGRSVSAAAPAYSRACPRRA